MIAIKTVNKTTKNSPVNDSQTEEKSIENIKEIYISPEKKSGNYWWSKINKEQNNGISKNNIFVGKYTKPTI